MRKTAVVALILIALGLAARAAEPPKDDKVERKGPLAGLPSAPGPTVEKIRGLGDNAWLNLGSPAPDPKWGKGRGRAWSSRMPYAPELHGAFLFGEGVHGWYNKENNRYMDDLFFYDVNAHRWLCLYPGADVKNIALKMNADGFEVDADGQPIPVSQMGHAYEQLTYDSDRRKFMFAPASCSNYQGSPLGERRKSWGGGYPWPYCPRQCSPWMYNVAAARFELLKTQGAAPLSRLGDVLVYVPGMKKLFYRSGGSRELWLYDPQGNAWSKLSPKGAPPPFGIDCLACLDSKRERIYLDGGYNPGGKPLRAFCCYDLRTNAWIDLQAKGQPCPGDDHYGTAVAAMNYDAANDAAVVFYHGLNKAAHGVYVYGAEANAWGDAPVPLPPGFLQGPYGCCVSSFYGPDLNAHFLYAAGDSDDNGTMWAYRHKRAVDRK